MSKEIEIGEKKGFPGGVNDKEAACSAGDFRYMGSIPGSGRSPEEGQPVQYFCLENSMDQDPEGLWSTGLQRARLD